MARSGRSGGRTLSTNKTSNMRPLDGKGRNISRGATRPSYKGPKTNRAAQKRALTRNH